MRTAIHSAPSEGRRPVSTEAAMPEPVIFSQHDTAAQRRARVMRRAWQLMGELYGYPRMPFKSIGRRCFGSALRQAWAEYRAVESKAALGVEAIHASIAHFTDPPRRVGLSTSNRWGNAANELAARRERALLNKALAYLGQPAFNPAPRAQL